MLLATLLVVFSMIAMGSLFFFIYITWTINEQLQDDDDVINKLNANIKYFFIVSTIFLPRLLSPQVIPHRG